MPREFSRASRVAEVIQREVAKIVQGEMHDPRVANVTITYTDMSRDMSQAKIYFTISGDDTVQRAAEQALNRAEGFIRHELRERVELRYIPHLRFLYDSAIDRGARLTRLIEETARREHGDSE